MDIPRPVREVRRPLLARRGCRFEVLDLPTVPLKPADTPGRYGQKRWIWDDADPTQEAPATLRIVANLSDRERPFGHVDLESSGVLGVRYSLIRVKTAVLPVGARLLQVGRSRGRPSERVRRRLSFDGHLPRLQEAFLDALRLSEELDVRTWRGLPPWRKVLQAARFRLRSARGIRPMIDLAAIGADHDPSAWKTYHRLAAERGHHGNAVLNARSREKQYWGQADSDSVTTSTRSIECEPACCRALNIGRLTCKRCGEVHEFITERCVPVEAPGWMLWWELVGVIPHELVRCSSELLQLDGR
jgi:hypothetical protein